MRNRAWGWVMMAMLLAGCAHKGVVPASGVIHQRRPATVAEAIAAKEDLWGEAALKRPEGPTYEYFAGLLPP